MSSSTEILFDPFPKQVEFIEATFSGKYNFILYGGAIRGGKALSLDTHIPTTTGWTTMGEIKQGDYVLGQDGKPAKVELVTPIMYDRQCYNVHFSDGSVITCDGEHLWQTLTQDERNNRVRHSDEFRTKRKENRQRKGIGKRPDLAERNSLTANSQPFKYPEPRTTNELIETLNKRHSIDIHAGFQLPEANLPIDPYLFGCWLGDGGSTTSNIFGANDDLLEIASHFTEEYTHYPEDIRICVKGLVTRIREVGCFDNKHIPLIYLRASFEQRLSLLQGIIDTDGTIGKNGQVEVCLSSEVLSYDVLELIRTMGIKANIRKSDSKLNGVKVNDRWRIKFCTTLPVARLKRKAERLAKNDIRPFYIERIEPVDSVPVRCIQVERGMYLCGKAMIPTHNTFALLGAFVLLSVAYPGSRWAVVRKDLPTIERNTYPSWDKIKPTNFIEKHDLSQHIVTFKNGSQILFFAENYDRDKELNRWKGLEVNGFGFEEINEMQEVSFNKAIERAGSYVIKSGKQPKPIILATCNPTNGWVKERIYTPAQMGTLPPTWLYISSKIYDNPYITDEYKESLQQLPVYERMVFVEGNWNMQLKTGGEFYKSFSLDKHVKPVTYTSTLPIHVTLDNNVHPYITQSMWQIEGRTIRQVGELPARDPNNSATKAAGMLVKWLRDRDYKDVVFLYGDPSANARTTIDENSKSFYDKYTERLRAEGFRVTNRVGRSAPEVALSGDFINDIYETNLYGYSIEIGESNKVSISDYVETKADMNGKVLKKRITDPVTQISYEKNGHFSDAKRYMIVELLKTEFIQYKSRGRKRPVSIPD